MRRSTLPALFVLLGAAARLQAQTSAPLHRAAATITAEEVGRRVGIIADDSMLGRDTPSRGLDMTAQYVADQFRQFGLKPGGDQGSWFQRYGIVRRRMLLDQSRVILSAGGTVDSAKFTAAARYDGGGVPEKPLTASTVLVTGAQTEASAAGAGVRDRIALYVPELHADPGMVQQVLRALYLNRPAALVVLNDSDSASFAVTLPRRPPGANGSGRTGIPTDGSPAADRRSSLLACRRRTRPAGAARLSHSCGARAAETQGSDSDQRLGGLCPLRARIPSGVLEGSDPELKQEYLVYSAHMDHIGITPGRPDSINNGADDDGSGTVGVMELAEAFSRPGARPKRSVIFLTVSGEEKGLWGSDFFTAHPPVPIKQIVADINIDMIGRNWRDTIVAIGKEHSNLGATLERVNRAHPELGMTAIDDRWPAERFYFRSDHYNFARRGVPDSLFLQWRPRGLSRGHRLARQDRQREGVEDPQAAVLSGTGHRQLARTTKVEPGVV